MDIPLVVIGSYEKDLEDLADRLAVERMHSDRELDSFCVGKVSTKKLEEVIAKCKDRGHRFDVAQLGLAHAERKLRVVRVDAQERTQKLEKRIQELKAIVDHMRTHVAHLVAPLGKGGMKNVDDADDEESE